MRSISIRQRFLRFQSVTIIMKEFIVLEFQSDIKASSRAIDFYAVRLIFKKKINNRGRERWERFVKFRK